MSRQTIAYVLGIIALLTYSAHSLFRILHWPGHTQLKWAAFLFLFAGGIVWIIDYVKSK